MEQLNKYCIYNSNAGSKRVSLIPEEPDSRYKTRQLRITINTTKKLTNLLNIDEVAADMHCEPEDIIRYIGYNLSTMVNVNKSYIAGDLQPNVVSKLLEQFIMEVILCYRCRLPELQYEISKGKVIQNCSACGCIDAMQFSNDKFEKYFIISRK